MKKIPISAIIVLGLAIFLIGVLVYVNLADKYVEPAPCMSNSLEACPASCAICPSCAACRDLACRDIQVCKDAGLYEPWFEQARSHREFALPQDEIKEIYEPVFKQYAVYNYFEVGECQETMCVKIYLKEDSPDLKKRIPAAIAGMKVIYKIIDPSQPADQGEACGFENCHGFNLSCGALVPDGCSEVYLLGDGCRKKAKCEIINGECRLGSLEDFEKCQACVLACDKDFAPDSMKIYTCEAECVK
jgi:hypothetical protein